MQVAKGRGLAFKLIAFILASTTIIFGAAFYYGHLASEKVVFEAVEESARNLAQATVNEIELALRGLEKISLQHGYLLEQYSFPREELIELLTSTVSNNPEIYGSAIAFQPHTFDPSARYFAPYCYREPDGRHQVIFLGVSSTITSPWNGIERLRSVVRRCGASLTSIRAAATSS